MILSVREHPGKLTTEVRLLAAIAVAIFSRGHSAHQMDDQALSFAFQRIFLHGGRDDAGGAALMHQLLHPGSFVPPAAPWPVPPAASWPALGHDERARQRKAAPPRTPFLDTSQNESHHLLADPAARLH